MSKHHYHVGHNVAGYLPEADIYAVATLAEARKFSRDNAIEAWNYERDPFNLDADTPKWRLTGRDGDYWLDNDSPYHIPTHFWVSDRCDCEEGTAELAE